MAASNEFRTEETILVVDLDNLSCPSPPCTFDMEFEAQVPVQIRRSGRNNKEGVDYSMAQWYPKMAEYDYEGWHPTPTLAREFYGIWGDFDVKITIDKKYDWPAPVTCKTRSRSAMATKQKAQK